MPIPPPIFTARPPRHRKATPVAVLPLVAVAFDAVGHRVDLTFGRAVNIAAMDPTHVVVDDSDNGLRFRGSGTPTLLAPAVVRVPLTNLGAFVVPVTILTAAAPTGIVPA